MWENRKKGGRLGQKKMVVGRQGGICGRREREGGRDISWEPPCSGRLIEALCGSRLRAVTPMKSPFAAFCRLCAEFWLCYQKLQPQTGTVTESSPNPTHTHTCASCMGIHNIHPIALLSSSQITCNRFRDILNTSSSHRVWIWMTLWICQAAQYMIMWY